MIENDVDPDGKRKPASAFKRKEVALPGGRIEKRVYRPGFRSVLNDLMAGRAQAVLAEDLDRACRDPRDLEDLIDACEEKRANARSLSGSLTITNGGTDAEVTTARIMVTMANKASRDAARRMEDSRTRRAKEGLWGGNGHRPFGYELLGSGRLAIIEAEAAVLRQAAAEVLSENFRPFYWQDYDGNGRPPGAESLTTLAAGLREAGFTTPGGKQWSAKCCARHCSSRPWPGLWWYAKETRSGMRRSPSSQPGGSPFLTGTPGRRCGRSSPTRPG